MPKSEKKNLDKSNKISFVFKGESLNSFRIDENILCCDFFKVYSNNQEKLNDLNEIIEIFCRNNQKNDSENNFLFLKFLIMVRKI